MSSVTVRRTTDLELIQSLEREVFEAYGDEPLAGKNLRDTAWWIAWVDGKPAGFGGVRILTNEKDTAFMVRVGVLPKYRRRGLHKRFNRVRKSYAKRAGCKYVVTYTLSHNITSSNNLIKAGFKLYRPASSWAGAGPETVYWILKL